MPPSRNAPPTRPPGPEPAAAIGGDLLYAPAMAEQVLTRWADWVQDVPEALVSGVVCAARVPPALDPGLPGGPSYVIVRAWWWGGPPEGRDLLDRWRGDVPPLVDRWGDLPVTPLSGIGAASGLAPRGPSTRGWLDRVDEQVARAVAGLTFPSGGPPVVVLSELRHVGGQVPVPGTPGSSDVRPSRRFAMRTLGAPETGPAPASTVSGTSAAPAHRGAVRRALGAALDAPGHDLPDDDTFCLDLPPPRRAL